MGTALVVGRACCVGQKPGEGRPKPKIAAVTGTVLDVSSGEALPFASVVVTSARDSSILGGVLSQEDGTFNLEEIEVGRLWLEIRFPGYVSQRIGPQMCSPRNPESLRWKVGNVLMEPDITALEEAVVVEQASVMEMRVDRRVFHVGNDLTNRGGNTTELLENIPSVNVDIDGNITLRGSAGCKSSSTAAPQDWQAGLGKPSWSLCQRAPSTAWSSSPTLRPDSTPTARPASSTSS